MNITYPVVHSLFTNVTQSITQSEVCLWVRN